MQPALIALDLDGTLLDDDQRVTPRGRAAIEKLTERGVHVVLATGRPTRMTRAFVHELGIEHAVVYDPMRQELFTASRGEGAQLDGCQRERPRQAPARL